MNLIFGAVDIRSDLKSFVIDSCHFCVSLMPESQIHSSNHTDGNAELLRSNTIQLIILLLDRQMITIRIATLG